MAVDGYETFLRNRVQAKRAKRNPERRFRYVNKSKRVQKAVEERKAIKVCLGVSIDDPAYDLAQSKWKAKGFKIAEVDSSLFGDSALLIPPDNMGEDTAYAMLNAMDETVNVSPVPRFKAHSVSADIHGVNAYFPDLGSICSTEQVERQGVLVDTIETAKANVTNNGGQTLIIVWDYIPANASTLNIPEFQDRPGGSMYYYPNDSPERSFHGGAVASMAGGKHGGLASGASLMLMGIGKDIETDLSFIDAVARQADVPTIVNLSWAAIWDNAVGSRLIGIRNSISALNTIVAQMKSDNPKLVFVAAAGNENINTCTDQALSFDLSPEDECVNCLTWPQFSLGSNNNPVLLVGSTKIYPSPEIRRSVGYTNYGNCVNISAHGGNSCLMDVDDSTYTAIQGTSFASPLVASIFSLVSSGQNNAVNNTALENMVLSSAEAGIDQVKNGTPDKFAVLPASFRTGGLVPVDLNLDIGEVDLLEPLSTGGDSTTIVVIAVSALVLIFILMYFFRK